MGTPSAKRISAKLGSAPARNSLNILGGGGTKADSPISIKVAESLRSAMSSGKESGQKQRPTGAQYNRKKNVSFGDKGVILQSDTKQIKGNPMDALPGKKGNVGFPGNGVD